MYLLVHLPFLTVIVYLKGVVVVVVLKDEYSRPAEPPVVAVELLFFVVLDVVGFMKAGALPVLGRGGR